LTLDSERSQDRARLALDFRGATPTSDLGQGQFVAPLAYGFRAAYITSNVGVGIRSSRPSATTLPASHGNSSLFPRNRSTAMDGIISAGNVRVFCSALVSRSAGKLMPRARANATTSA